MYAMSPGRRYFMDLHDDGLKPLLEEVEILSTRQRVRNAYPSYDHRTNRQNDKWKGHAAWRFVRLEVPVRYGDCFQPVCRIVRTDVLTRLVVWAIVGSCNRRVVRFQAFVMRSGEAVCCLQCVINSLALSECDSAHALAKSFAFQQFRDDVRRTIVRIDVINNEDVRMIQRAGSLSFLLKSRESLFVSR